MDIRLGERTEDSVRIYYEKAQDPIIKRSLPQKARSVEEALEDYRNTLLPGASSYGRTILLDGAYVGDIWIYCIDPNDEPNAMLSFCVFEKAEWGRGAATEAAKLFLNEVCERFDLKTIGAFVFADNHASIRVLEKNGFELMEEFEEEGRKSAYYLHRRK